MTDRYEEGRRSLEEVAPRADLWREVERRASGGELLAAPHSGFTSRRALLAALTVAAAAAVAAVALLQPDDGPERLDTTPVTEPDEGSPTSMVTGGLCSFGVAGESIALDPGPADPQIMAIPAHDDPVIVHTEVGDQRVEIHVPGLVVSDLVAERLEAVELDRGTAQMWIRDDLAQVRWFPGGDDPCETFTVSVAGGSEAENRRLAMTFAGIMLMGSDLAPGVPETVTTVQGLDSLGDGFAIWPETDRIQLSADEAPSSADQNETALSFARIVLGWDDAVVTDGEPSEDGRFGANLTVESASRQGSTSISVAPLVGDRYRVYRVDSRAGDLDERSATVSVQGSRAYASAGPVPAGTARSVVRFDYSGQVSEGPAGEEFELSAVPTGTGSVLVLYLDAAGEVIGAWGATLPAGDFAAG